MTKISQKLTKKGADTFLLGHKTYSMTANCMCQHNYQVKCKKKPNENISFSSLLVEKCKRTIDQKRIEKNLFFL